LGFGVALLASCSSRGAGQDQVRQRIHAAHGPPNAALKDVERDDGGQRDQKADRRGHQRLGDAGHDHRRATALILSPDPRRP
jgi:hypothetical protein